MLDSVETPGNEDTTLFKRAVCALRILIESFARHGEHSILELSTGSKSGHSCNHSRRGNQIRTPSLDTEMPQADNSCHKKSNEPSTRGCQKQRTDHEQQRNCPSHLAQQVSGPQTKRETKRQRQNDRECQIIGIRVNAAQNAVEPRMRCTFRHRDNRNDCHGSGLDEEHAAQSCETRHCHEGKHPCDEHFAKVEGADECPTLPYRRECSRDE